MEKKTYKLYKGKVSLSFDESKHIYSVDKKIVYGVTGVTGILNKPALIYWAVKLAVNKVLKNRNLLSNHLEAVLEAAKKEHTEQSKKARELGIRVHLIVDEWFNGDKMELMGKMLEIISQEERQSLSALIQFFKKYKLVRKYGERKIYSKKYHYAGTVDYLGTVDGIMTIVDFKTSAAIYDDYFIQVAAYAQALEEEGEKIKQTAIVRIGKDGKLEVKIDKNWKEKVPVFVNLLNVYSWQMKEKDKKVIIRVKKKEKVKLVSKHLVSKQKVVLKSKDKKPKLDW